MLTRKSNEAFVMPFGKYIGCFLSDIYEEDRKYFEWLETLDNSPELTEAIQQIKEQSYA